MPSRRAQVRNVDPLPGRRLRITVEEYSGTAARKTALKKRWDAGDVRVIAGQIYSLSHGLNMQYGGHNCAVFGIPTDYDAFEQFYKRMWRSGQEHTVNMFILIARDTWEEGMADILVERGTTQKKFLARFKRQFKL